MMTQDQLKVLNKLLPALRRTVHNESVENVARRAGVSPWVLVGQISAHKRWLSSRLGFSVRTEDGKIVRGKPKAEKAKKRTRR